MIFILCCRIFTKKKLLNTYTVNQLLEQLFKVFNDTHVLIDKNINGDRFFFVCDS